MSGEVIHPGLDASIKMMVITLALAQSPVGLHHCEMEKLALVVSSEMKLHAPVVPEPSLHEVVPAV